MPCTWCATTRQMSARSHDLNTASRGSATRTPASTIWSFDVVFHFARGDEPIARAGEGSMSYSGAGQRTRPGVSDRGSGGDQQSALLTAVRAYSAKSRQAICGSLDYAVFGHGQGVRRARLLGQVAFYIQDGLLSHVYS